MKAISSEVFVNGKLLNTPSSLDEPKEINELLDCGIKVSGSIELQTDNRTMMRLNQLINRNILGW